ncbi:MAG: choice-of-anchor D domain-containing protein [Ruegeria sp.]|uniref:choice-of-anchor D domain-containing protein n=1 Tax=Ruegeria sp. TaxID=1879320 RepID=UPI00349EB9AB
MQRNFDSAFSATVTRDSDKQIRSIRYEDEFPEIKAGGGRGASKSFLRRMAKKLGIAYRYLSNLDQEESFLDPDKREVEYRFSDEKTFFDTTTYVYRQTYLNTPVWSAGLTVTVKHDDGQVLSLTNTSETGIDAKLPPAKDINRYRKLFATGEKGGDKGSSPKSGSIKGGRQTLLSDILAEAVRKYPEDAPRLIRGRFFIYRYDAEKRLTDHPDRSPGEGSGAAPDTETDDHPTLPLGDVPKSIKDGSWRFVAELIVRLPVEGERLNWRLLVDVDTDAVLYLRVLASGVNGLVFTYDPITSTGDNGNDATQGNAVLNPLRDDVVLEGLDPPVGGTQSLSGNLVAVVEVENPAVAPPTQPAGSDFDFNARTNDFAAVNAYYHNDRFFRLVEDLGFPLDDYFDGTSFPVEIDHRGLGGANNAHCIGDGDGIDHACYGLINSAGGTPMSNAVEWSVVLHELGGHGILYDHVNSANLGFSHSQGDSFAIILNDFASEWHNGGAIDRFVRSPFRQNLRRSDRAVADGWGWGGPNDDGTYGSEQVLSTTMFRAYRSIGGDSTHLTRREFSARVMSYLLLRAVGTLSPVSNPNSPGPYLDALLTADEGDWTTEGLFGGAYGKVLTWSFEQQDLNGGVPPLVDVYIDDGRAGEYEFLDDFADSPAIWNRRAPDGLEGHQEPSLGTNYAYVKVKNRGTSQANSTVVRGFHSMPLAGRVWPDDLQPMVTPELAAGTVQPNDAEEIIVGPFEWVPNPNAEGHDSMMMIVSAEGDPSNADKFTGVKEIEDWRLVPNDNNIAVKDVRLEPRLVTVIADNGEFGNVCVDSHKDMKLVLSNSGFSMLSVSNITSSSAEFEVPGVMDYPIAIDSGDSVIVPIRYRPSGFGPSAAAITVFSNDPEGPKTVRVSAESRPPRLVTIIADHGDFGDVCLKSHRDLMLTLNNSGRCPLTINSISSSSAEFVVADVASYPIVVGSGDFVQVPIRFEPASHGNKSGVITIDSNDPSGKKTIRVSGKVPAGRLTVTGSTCIGGVKACCLGERTIKICNTGKCALTVASVGFSRKSKYWKLVNNPFPAVLPPGSCLDLLIRYKAAEKCPKALQLVIKSDDPDAPVKCLDLMAYTAWQRPGNCKSGCDCSDDCDCCGSDDGCGVQSLDPCCFDEECEEQRDGEC